MFQQPNSNHNHKKYNHIEEVPFSEIEAWQAEHCFNCGTPLMVIEREWHMANVKAAEEATPKTLEFYMEKFEAQSYDEVRELIRQGLLMDGYPVFTIQSRRLPFSDVQTTYHVCSHCFYELFSQNPCREDLSMITPN